MKQVIVKVSLIILTLSSVSCATILGNNDRSVRIRSNVPGALVTVDGSSYGNAPTEVYVGGMDIYSDNVITLEKKGYNSRSSRVKTSFQLVSLLNVFNGYIGILIDVLTGNVMKVSSHEVNIPLEKS